ncbi:ABC transporter permease [Planotetraspora kaengkrachanensis]|uniref:ABC transporter substrate-binding protein n=1 Tax=Planotetraspora kaengkrachanensis TaxID=575193 RepID=A0A8J3PVN4_9ACTN|nr:FtsX-like permease family protein [Planotetraspora kaengkrachanensis]GIG81798.1 ABC transporter substrate-binding protein [Planotetraspora kaengkrachanensis]
MFRTTIAGLLAHRLRLLLTSLAIILGVGFIAGTFVLTDTIDAGFSQSFTAAADKIDVAVLAKDEENPLPPSLLAKVGSVAGVKDAQPVVSGEAALIGKDGKTIGELVTAGVAFPSYRMDLTSGSAPVSDGEAVVDTNTAKTEGFRIGDTIAVLDDKNARHEFRLVGTFDVGVDQSLAARGAVAYTPATAMRMTGAKGYAEIDVTTAGPSRESLRTAIAAVAGSGATVQTGEELASDLAASNGASTEYLKIGLLLFGVVALLVAGLVIYNTFGILVAQRMRELALLRCIGATRRQVFGSIVLESTIVGLVSSVLGLGAGLGMGGLAVFLLNTFSPDVEVPTGTVTLSPQTIVIGLATGLIMTVVAALLPARQATKVAPVAALRTQTEEHTFRTGVVRIVFAVIFGLAAAGLTYMGVTAKPDESALMTVMAGGILAFFSVLILGPVLVTPLSGLAGWLPGRLFGVPGRLATENSRRNPKRSATTTIALTIGVTLMTFMAVLTATMRATADQELDSQFVADYRVAAQTGDVPHAVAEALRGHPELATVAEFREAEGRLDDKDYPIGTVTSSVLESTMRPKATSGSTDGFKPGTVMIADYVAEHLKIKVGDDVRIGTEKDATPLRVVAILDSESLLPSITVPEQFFAERFGKVDDNQILIIAADGADQDKARAIVDNAAQPYPAVKVTSSTEIRDQFDDAIGGILSVITGLLGLAIVISLLGIANTLSLSVHERTRESALLRALGLKRGQLRGMLTIEALILGLVGALVGTVLGIVYGWAATETIAESVSFQLPVGQILLFIAASGLAGVLAAVLPARRAARTSIVGSLASD